MALCLANNLSRQKRHGLLLFAQQAGMGAGPRTARGHQYGVKEALLVRDGFASIRRTRDS
jgi:hypothetical protein